MSGQIEQENLSNQEQPKSQEKLQVEIIKKLKQFFVAENINELKMIMQTGTEKERALLKTAVQVGRPILTVNIFKDETNVLVDKHKSNGENVKLPIGSLEIKYGKAEDDAADLIVYVWRDENNLVQFGVYTENIDHEKGFATGMGSSSNPDYIRDDHVSQSPAGASSYPGGRPSDQRTDSKKPGPVYL